MEHRGIEDASFSIIDTPEIPAELNMASIVKRISRLSGFDQPRFRFRCIEATCYPLWDTAWLWAVGLKSDLHFHGP